MKRLHLAYERNPPDWREIGVVVVLDRPGRKLALILSCWYGDLALALDYRRRP